MSTALFFLPLLLVLGASSIAGVLARRTVRRVNDFTNAGGRLTAGVVAGALVGGFVGGTSIVGTGELAYRQGLSALWFTLGGGLAIMLLGLAAGRLRRVRVETLPSLIGQVYGERARLGASLFLCAGMFIQVIAQILAALPFVSAFGRAPGWLEALVPALMILAYVWFGGFMGASVVGTIKTALLALLLAGTGMWLAGALNGAAYMHWWDSGRLSLMHDGPAAAASQCLSMIVGIFSTQAYLQPIFAAGDERAARRGAVAAGLAVMAIGMVSAWIGLYMADAHPALPPREAVPQFFLQHTPAWAAGFAYAVVLLSVVMTGAALVLSISTVLNQDIIQRLTGRFAGDRAKLAVSRSLIVAVLALAYGIVCGKADSLILEWTYLSMTLRGVTVFCPVVLYLAGAGHVRPAWAAAAVWGGPLAALAWWWLGAPATGIDPLFVGGAWSLGALLAGRFREKDPSLRPSA